MNLDAEPRDLLVLARRLLERLSAPALAPFLAEWPRPQDRHGAPLREAREAQAAREALDAPPVRRAALPVLHYLPLIVANATSHDSEFAATPFVRALCEAAPSLEWRQTYTLAEMGAAFLQNYGWSELLGPTGGKTSAQISCGVVVLGPHTLYPLHRHEAEEIYIPLSGTAQWQQGDALWRIRLPGTLIHHRSEEPHAMRTGNEPLLAMYLWRSANLDQKARLERPGSADGSIDRSTE
ncbi:MAG TPA: dimethylsulfonioproprionate lyase family protein [Steroidobacteraceae bacterium]|nr:dimethylsulfonioproprionate lyase family protein [Steroidobacteraceae bacterium]